MRKLQGIGLLLTCVLALAGCKTAGVAVKPVVCPALPTPPANLMHPPRTEMILREELLVPAQPATRK